MIEMDNSPETTALLRAARARGAETPNPENDVAISREMLEDMLSGAKFPGKSLTPENVAKNVAQGVLVEYLTSLHPALGAAKLFFDLFSKFKGQKKEDDFLLSLQSNPGQMLTSAFGKYVESLVETTIQSRDVRQLSGRVSLSEDQHRAGMSEEAILQKLVLDKIQKKFEKMTAKAIVEMLKEEEDPENQKSQQAKQEEQNMRNHNQETVVIDLNYAYFGPRSSGRKEQVKAKQEELALAS